MEHFKKFTDKISDKLEHVAQHITDGVNSMTTSQENLETKKDSSSSSSPPTFPPVTAYNGPYLKFVNSDANHWKGSLLIVVKNASHTPILTISNPTLKSSLHITADKLFVCAAKDSVFYRFDITLPLGANGTEKYSYTINNDQAKKFDFYVPGKNLPLWEWVFYSCNGLSSDVDAAAKEKIGGVTPLWEDLMRRHAQKPFHVSVGGGDQVYADDMWYSIPSIVEWLKIKGHENRRDHSWNPQFENETNQFYFDLYVKSWDEPFMRDAYASIPQVNLLDDHDVWDGFGTYPEFLNQSHVFVNASRIAVTYYMLFQHHTTIERACTKDGYFGAKNKTFSFTRQFGPSTSVLAIDARNERTMDQIVSPESWGILKKKLSDSTIPSTCQHLVVITGVPVIHPRLDFADKSIETFGDMKKTGAVIANSIKGALPFLSGTIDTVKKSLGKTGLMKSMINHFGLPELEDDLKDHWTHEIHATERNQLIDMLQEFALRRKVRVTFIAGDVHCCLTGKFFNTAEPESLDYRLMYQITSSAIANVAPPPPVIMNVNQSGQSVYQYNESTSEKMVRLFEKDVDGSKFLSSDCVMGRRNYCQVSGGVDGELVFNHMIESDVKGAPAVAYTVQVPLIK